MGPSREQPALPLPPLSPSPALTLPPGKGQTEGYLQTSCWPSGDVA